MSRYEEIKKLLENSRTMLNKDILKEDYNTIRSFYGLLKEENEESVIDDAARRILKVKLNMKLRMMKMMMKKNN